MWILSGLADALVLLPASLGLIALLIWVRAYADATAYAKALVFCLTAVFAMKFALATCGPDRPFLGVESPSGHVAFAATFYGCLALLLTARQPRLVRIAILTGVAALAALVAASRIVLHAHNALETGIGAATGLMAMAIFRTARPKVERPAASGAASLPLAPLVALYILCLLVAANHWTAEPWIDAMAEEFGAIAGLCR